MEGKSKIVWLASDSLNGIYQEVGQGDNLLLTDALKGSYFKAVVTPVDEVGNNGNSYSTAVYFDADDQESFDALLVSLEAEFKDAEAGDELGQYPQSALKAFSDVLEECKNGSEDITVKSEKLRTAYKELKDAQVTSVNCNSNSITVPAGLEKLHIWLKETPEFSLITSEALPETIIETTVNGVAVTFALPQGTKVNGMLFKVTDQLSTTAFLNSRFVIKTASVPMGITIADMMNLPYTVKDNKAIKIIPNIKNETMEFDFDGGELALATAYTPSSDATLRDIKVNGRSVSNFDPERLDYKFFVPENSTDWEVSATASDASATVEITQAAAPNQVVPIKVTAQDGTTILNYTVHLGVMTTPTVTPTTPTAPPLTGGNGGGLVSVGGGNNSNKTEETAKPSKFTDIIGHWAEKDINEMTSKGIVSGMTATTFEPDRSITRAEFTALMARALKLSAANTESVFNDVASNAWYADEVAAAAATGLIVGYDGHFRPDDTITREEMAVVIMKAYKFLGKSPLNGKIDQFADKDEISEWALSYVDQAVSSGLISGMTSDIFAPRDNATRAQVASLIKRLLNY